MHLIWKIKVKEWRVGWALFLCWVFTPLDLLAGDLLFGLPVDCSMGTVCFVQNYFDHQDGPGRKDYTCGRLSYNGHKGTDIRVRNIPDMNRGVPVVAAAPGKVLRIRDGMPDVNLKEIDPVRIRGREAGNGVLIDHGGGWVTQYSHLKKGSVRVKPGQQVHQGDLLGLIGLSGNTEFPHVEFTVRYEGRAVDPYTGVRGFTACGHIPDTLWDPKALPDLAYRETGLLTAGFAGEKPDAKTARAGGYPKKVLDRSIPVLILWVDLFGVQKGDRQRFTITGPDGTPPVDHVTILDKSNVSSFAFAGIRRPATGWRNGAYTGTYSLERGGNSIVRVTRSVVVE